MLRAAWPGQGFLPQRLQPHCRSLFQILDSPRRDLALRQQERGRLPPEMEIPTREGRLSSRSRGDAEIDNRFG